jgi:uncharacterized membrane-anchored protein
MASLHNLRHWLTCLLPGLVSLLFLSAMVNAQDEEAEPAMDAETQRLLQLYTSIQWQEGPTSVDIGSNATLLLPEGYRLTGRQGSVAWNQFTQNPPDKTIATLMPTAEDQNWFLCFEFSDVGYVKDDEELDADALLSSMKEGTEASNEYRRQQGWGGIHIEGWILPPKYDTKTRNLVWATKLRDDEGHENANHNIRILGRRGVMTVTLVAGLDEMNSAIAATDQLLTGFNYKTGDTYAEFTSGDKVAQYGLTGLIAGGAAIAAVKTGLFGKLLGLIGKAGKAIVLVIVAVLAGLKRLFFGKPASE